MERRGVYRKGSQGHVRNIGAYRMFRQNFKKWRVPMTVLFALFVVFSTAPSVGDQLTASVLTASQTAQLDNATSSQESAKVLLGMVKDRIDECQKFYLDDCVAQGNALTTTMVSFGNDVSSFKGDVENFIGRFQSDVAKAACRYTLSLVATQIGENQHTLQEFNRAYGETLNDAQLNEYQSSLLAVSKGLNVVVDSCETR